MTLGISAIVGPEIFARMFTDKKELVDLTASVMPVYFFGITILGSRWHGQCAVYRTGAGKVITVCGTFEKGDFARAIAIILPKYFGVSGIYYAEQLRYYCSICDECLIFDDHQESFCVIAEIMI